MAYIRNSVFKLQGAVRCLQVIVSLPLHVVQPISSSLKVTHPLIIPFKTISLLFVYGQFLVFPDEHCHNLQHLLSTENTYTPKPWPVCWSCRWHYVIDNSGLWGTADTYEGLRIPGARPSTDNNAGTNELVAVSDGDC